MAKRELIKKITIDRLKLRIEWYMSEKGNIYYLVRDIKTGKFTSKPNYLVVKFLKSGEYPEDVKRKGKGSHPFFMEIAVTRSYDFDEFVDDLFETEDYDKVIDSYYSKIEDDIINIEKTILKKQLSWEDENADEMIDSEHWVNKLVGYEIETSDVEEEEEKLLEWHR